MIVDGCAGPRGWSEGLKMLGLSDVGIEWASARADRNEERVDALLAHIATLRAERSETS